MKKSMKLFIVKVSSFFLINFLLSWILYVTEHYERKKWQHFEKIVVFPKIASIFPTFEKNNEFLLNFVNAAILSSSGEASTLFS